MYRAVTLFLAILLSSSSSGARPPILPAGYRLQAGSAGQNFVRYDFDGDGKIDVFCAAEKTGEEDARLLAVMKLGSKVSFSSPISICCGSISQKGGVVNVQSRGMRGFSYYKFRWDTAKKDFRLIGYDTESFGNAAGEGSGRSSMNLLTGAFEAAMNRWDEKRQQLMPLPKVKRHIPVSRSIYLRNFGESDDQWLAELAAQYMPAEGR